MTAEDAGAGVQAGTLVLTVRPEGAAPVPLPLHEAEPLIGDWSGQPAVEAGVPVSLEVSGLPPRAAVTVRIGGEVLAGDQYREEDCVHLELQDPLPFDNMIGVAKLEVLVSMGPQACSFFHAEPLRIILKPGLASDNLLRMSESVAEHVERLFGGDAVRTGDDSLGDLLGVLERLSSLYERQYPYFREDPKCRLASTARRMSIERMRDMTPEAARWMASHPHEWQRVAPGHGIRMRGANWMPAHALVRTSELSRDLYENRVVAGFPLHLASETRRLAQAFEDAVRVGAGPLDAGTIGRMAAVRIVSSEADVLRGYGIVFSRIAELYRDALGVTPEPVNRLASVTSPRLYEYFSLVSLLGGLERRGWTSVEAKRHEYAGAGPLYADNAAAALLNTFIFRRKEDDGGNEEIVRLWYQPVLAAGNVEPENGIGLARTTRWSVRPLNAEAADTLRETDRAWYSPDFLISLESGGRTAWAVMDSKYSTVGTVLRHHAMQQAFKYLTSLGTVRKDDVYAGLWLYCGSVANDRTQEGSFFNASAPDVLPVPDMVLERVNALSEADPIAGVLERLRTVLAR